MKELSSILICTLFCSLLLGALAFAHGNMEHIMGTVVEIKAARFRSTNLFRHRQSRLILPLEYPRSSVRCRSYPLSGRLAIR